MNQILPWNTFYLTKLLNFPTTTKTNKKEYPLSIVYLSKLWWQTAVSSSDAIFPLLFACELLELWRNKQKTPMKWNRKSHTHIHHPPNVHRTVTKTCPTEDIWLRWNVCSSLLCMIVECWKKNWCWKDDCECILSMSSFLYEYARFHDSAFQWMIKSVEKIYDCSHRNLGEALKIFIRLSFDSHGP